MRDNLLPEHKAVRSTRHCLQRVQCTWGGLYRTEPLFVTGFYLLAPLKPAIWKGKALFTERPHIPKQNLGKAKLQEGLLTLLTPTETLKGTALKRHRRVTGLGLICHFRSLMRGDTAVRTHGIS